MKRIDKDLINLTGGVSVAAYMAGITDLSIAIVVGFVVMHALNYLFAEKQPHKVVERWTPPTPADVFDAACNVTGSGPAAVLNGHQTPPAVMARRLFLWLTVKRYGNLTLSNAARFLGRDPSYGHTSVSEIEKRLIHNPDWAREFYRNLGKVENQLKSK